MYTPKAWDVPSNTWYTTSLKRLRYKERSFMTNRSAIAENVRSKQKVKKS